MATSRWRPSTAVRLRLEIVGFEVFLLALMLFAAGVAEMPSFMWFLLVFVSVVVQSVLFYRIGRVREQLDH